MKIYIKNDEKLFVNISNYLSIFKEHKFYLTLTKSIKKLKQISYLFLICLLRINTF